MSEPTGEEITAWHWMRADRQLRYPPHTRVEPGQTLRAAGPLELNANGLHGSLKALDALRYAPGFIVARTAHGGEIVHSGDILCSRTRTALWIVDARAVVCDWLCVLLDRCLTRETEGRHDHPDARVWSVLTTLQRYARGEAPITDVRNATYTATMAASAADAAFHTAAHATYPSAVAAQAAYAAASLFANAARAVANATRAVATDNAAQAARAAANAARVATRSTYVAERERMNTDLECRLIAAHERESTGHV